MPTSYKLRNFSYKCNTVVLYVGCAAAPLGYTRAGRHAANHRCCVTGSSSVLMKHLPVGSRIY